MKLRTPVVLGVFAVLLSFGKIAMATEEPAFTASLKEGPLFRYNEDIELEDAIHTAILTLKEGFEGQMTENNIEIGIVDLSGRFRVLTPAEVKDYLGGAE